MRTNLGTTIVLILALVIGFGLIYRSVIMLDYEISGAHQASLHEVSKDFFASVKQKSILEQELQEVRDDMRVYHTIVGGDIMLDRGVEVRVKNPNIGNGDWTFPWHDIAPIFRDADLAFGNLEGALSDIGKDGGKKYSFRFPVEAREGLTYAGFDLVSLANNHMLDWGYGALCDSVENVKEVGIGVVGAGCNEDEAEAPYIAEFGDTRVAFIAFTEFYQGAVGTDTRPGITNYNTKHMIETIQDLKNNQGIDIVMLSMHWGIEYKERSSSAQQELAHKLIDAGLDVLIGHHPHVPQEIERYGDGWVIYSLGNLVFDQSWSEATMKGLIADIQIQNGRVYDITPIPIQLNENYQPRVVE